MFFANFFVKVNIRNYRLEVFIFKAFYTFQMHKLEADMRPLQESNSELSEQSGMLQAEKRLLEEDVKRWKTRTQV